MIAEAERAGLRVILSFVDNWKYYGGIDEVRGQHGQEDRTAWVPHCIAALEPGRCAARAAFQLQWSYKQALQACSHIQIILLVFRRPFRSTWTGATAPPRETSATRPSTSWGTCPQMCAAMGGCCGTTCCWVQQFSQRCPCCFSTLFLLLTAQNLPAAPKQSSPCLPALSPGLLQGAPRVREQAQGGQYPAQPPSCWLSSCPAL